MLIKGSQLNARQRALVLAAFVHRHTHENARQSYGGRCPNCAQSTHGGRIITGSRRGPVPLREWTPDEWHAYHTSHGAPLQTDAAWLEAHAFHFVKDGSRLSARHNRAEPAFMADADTETTGVLVALAQEAPQ